MKVLKLHLDTIKPRSVEYLQKRHNKAKGCGRGRAKPSFQTKPPGSDTQLHGHQPGPGKNEKYYYCGLNTRHFYRSKCPAWKNLCKKCGFKGHYELYCGKISPMLKCQSENVHVQEVKTNETDQNTGKIQNEVDIVNMIRSLGLHKAKKDSQLRPTPACSGVKCLSWMSTNTSVQSPSASHKYQCFVGECQDIMNVDIYVATGEKIPNMVDLNVITIHDVESKCAYYLYCTIAGHAVKMKQDTGAEGNVMSKHVFDKIGNGVKSQIVLNKVKTTQITGYGKTPSVTLELVF